MPQQPAPGDKTFSVFLEVKPFCPCTLVSRECALKDMQVGRRTHARRSRQTWTASFGNRSVFGGESHESEGEVISFTSTVLRGVRLQDNSIETE